MKMIDDPLKVIPRAIKATAARYHSKLKTVYLDRDDLISGSYVAALKRKSFDYITVCNGIVDEIRRWDYSPRFKSGERITVILKDEIEINCQSHMNGIILDDLSTKLKSLFEQLTDREYQVIKSIYYDENPQTEFAKKNNISEGRTNIIHRNAKRKLKRLLNDIFGINEFR